MSDIGVKPSPNSISTWLWAVATVLIPLVVTAAAQMSGVFQKSRELDIKMIELGVGILRAGPQETGAKGARGWAVDVVEKYSGVTFTNQARTELINSALPVVVSSTQAPTVSSEETTAASGWVAVGFPGSTNPSDQNFTTLTGAPITPDYRGIIKAKWSVNVRPGAASWNSVNSVLNAGQCFSIQEGKLLKAGLRDQMWARGDIADCSK